MVFHKPWRQSRSGEERDEALRIVRRFSEHIGEEHPQNDVAQGLQLVEEYQQAQEESHNDESHSEALLIVEDSETTDSAIVSLNAEMAQMKEAWVQLLSRMSKEDRAVLGNQNLNFNAVQSAIDYWLLSSDAAKDPQKSNVKAHFHRFCETMDAYSSLFSFIPDDDKYIKPLCGAITTIVKASVNHEKIAQEFASALGDIGVHMTNSRDLLIALRSQKSVASVDKLVRIVAQLCTKIFHFLVPYLQWGQSRWERVKGSLSKNYAEDNVHGPLSDIMKTSEYLRQEAEVQKSKVLIHTEGLAEEGLSVAKDIQTISTENLERTKNLERLMQKRLETNRFESLSQAETQSILQGMRALLAVGESGQKMLVSTSARSTYDQEAGYPGILELERAIQPSDAMSPSVPSVQGMERYTFAEIEPHTRSIGMLPTGFFDGRMQNPPNIARSVFRALQDWLSASGSRTLWAYGPSNAIVPSELSTMSSYVVNIVNSMKVPLLAHRCQSDDSRADSLIKMVYSLILQLVWLLPDEFVSDKIFNSARFNALDGRLESLEGALILMEDLLSMAPPLLVCVLDGFQLAEDGSGDVRGTGMFLNLFLEILKESKEAKILKILSTTDGFCHRLWQRLDPEEQVDATKDVKRFPSQAKKDRVSLANLKMMDEQG